MAASGGPRGDDPGPEQEGIWEEPSEAARDAPTTPVKVASPGTEGLTSRLTSTAHMPGPAGLAYADVPNRIMALVIDIIVLSVIGFALAWLFGGLVSEAGAIDAAGGQLDLVAFLVVLVLQLALSIAYFAGLWTSIGATVGMRLLGLRIGDEADGRAISWRQSLIRWLLLGLPALLSSLAIYVPNTIGLILGALGVVWMLLLLYTVVQSPTKQGLQDRYAHTILVKVRRHTA